MESNQQTPPAPPADFHYPPDLPISAFREQILAALRASQVVVVCGDTGSGKTTQLPKMAMELGLGARGRKIGCTQPRRLAAVTVAERVAGELQTEVGGLVGYQHRFGHRVSAQTRVKFMTDGVLLAETRNDPLLRAYDALIIDEVHERSLNIDFLLGILKRILSRRRDLKVVVSSATLDVDLFRRFFGGAPAVVVPGRLFPIAIEYRPPADDEIDLPRDVVRAVGELPADGDILVFLPGERDIRETAEALDRRPGGTADDVIPLLASLPAGEQRRAFHASERRRIILATNVAETSVTIPGIRFVIDSGLARISRYVHRTQIQRLQIEPVSQASARQRAGRCGRLGPGICIRLYSEADFNARDAFTPPEVLRSSLAGVILAMLDLNLGDVAQFPFLEPPRPAMVHEGLRELLELGAIARDRNGAPALSAIGRKLARIPVEPRLARMLLAAADNAVLPRAIPLVAAMSCDDPRRRPVDEREKAAQAHAPFRVPGSDFLGTLRLWDWWERESRDLSQTKARKLCQATYLSYPKMREWRDLARQLTALAERLGLSFAAARRPPEEDDALLHRSLLSGLLGRIGRFDPETHDYRGARGLRFALHPGSVLARKNRPRDAELPERVVNAHRKAVRPVQTQFPPWIMAGELVDTARLFARNAAVLDPAWIEPVAGDLCRHHYHSPVWDPASGFVRATEQVTLHGLVVVPARRCDFSRIDPPLARSIFIRHALVDGEFPHPPAPVRENSALLDRLRRLADRLRRPELFDAGRLTAAFGDVLPPDVCSAAALRQWLARATPQELARFQLRKKDWWPDVNPTAREFPDTIRIGEAVLSLSYRHAPEEPDADGITCTVNRSDAAVLRLWRSDWLVPGALPEKIMWLLSTLPNSLRRLLLPLEDSVSGLLAMLKPGTEPLADAVRHAVYGRWGFRIPPTAWDNVRLPVHFRVRYRIRDDRNGRILAVSRDLNEVLRLAGVPDAPSVRAGADASARHVAWDFGTIPERTMDARAGWKLEHFPALHDEGDGVSLHLHADEKTAAAAHATAVTRLYLLALGRAARRPFRTKDLSLGARLYLKTVNYAEEKIADDILSGAARAAFVAGRPPVRDAAEFEKRLLTCRADFYAIQAELENIVAQSATAAAALSDQIDRSERLAPETVDSIRTQLAWLLFPGFARLVPLVQLRHYARYLKGVAVRLERARVSPSGDTAKELRYKPFWERYAEAVTADPKPRLDASALVAYRWMLEEYRISIFAQELRTAYPVSPQRLNAKWDEVVAD
ncbi:MAG: ATP-dependent RNA helicase HrpA [Kiritimatiellia bacterium]